LAEFIHLKAHPPFRFDCAQAKSEKLHHLAVAEVDELPVRHGMCGAK
jgi:hypothetical protein